MHRCARVSGSDGESGATLDDKGGVKTLSRHTRARAQVIRLLRLARGQTLQEVAADIPCDIATLSRRERGLSTERAEEFDFRALLVLGGADSLRQLIQIAQDALDWLEWAMRQNQPLKPA